jgi:MFS-type transporter involved in bile tolerance (Atg22 family)
MDDAVRHIAGTYAPKGNYIGILMLASLFVEAWDYYSIAFVLTFIRQQFNPSPLILGLTTAAVQAGAVFGAVLGGWLTDKLGRRVMFMASIVLFIVLALAQGFVTSIAQLLVIWAIAGVAAWVGPAVLPRLGHRGVGIAGFSTVIAGLSIAAYGLYNNHPYVLPLAAAIMMWGHIWAVTNPLTIATVVSRAEYRGIAGGFTYVFNKVAVFMGIFLFPSLFAAIGQANATTFVIVFPVVGLLAAIFLLREVYGFQLD